MNYKLKKAITIDDWYNEWTELYEKDWYYLFPNWLLAFKKEFIEAHPEMFEPII
jgi:hypothetical protein